MNKDEIRNKAKELKDQGALFVINHSGGKDSQAMFLHLTGDLRIPAAQVLVIHADLPGVDWDGIADHIEKTTEGFDFQVTRSHKTFFEMVRSRGMFPSSQHRQCTSDLKRDPIDKFVRNYMKQRGLSLVVSCMGIRSDESPARSKKNPFKLNKRNSRAGRTWFDFYPIFTWTQEEVFYTIEYYNQEPFWTYAKGMTRVSCRFCILASKGDLCTAAKLAPDHFQEMVDLEKEIDFTLQQGKTLEQITQGS